PILAWPGSQSYYIVDKRGDDGSELAKAEEVVLHHLVLSPSDNRTRHASGGRLGHLGKVELLTEARGHSVWSKPFFPLSLMERPISLMPPKTPWNSSITPLPSSGGCSQ